MTGAAVTHLLERGVSTDAIEKFGLGYAPSSSQAAVPYLTVR